MHVGIGKTQAKTTVLAINKPCLSYSDFISLNFCAYLS